MDMTFVRARQQRRKLTSPNDGIFMTVDEVRVHFHNETHTHTQKNPGVHARPYTFSWKAWLNARRMSKVRSKPESESGQNRTHSGCMPSGHEPFSVRRNNRQVHAVKLPSEHGPVSNQSGGNPARSKCMGKRPVVTHIHTYMHNRVVTRRGRDSQHPEVAEPKPMPASKQQR